MMDAETLNSEQAGKLLHCSTNLACEMARKGDIPATQIAGQWIFVKEQLVEWIKRRALEEQLKRQEAARHAALVIVPSIEEQRRGRGRPRGKSMGIPPDLTVA